MQHSANRVKLPNVWTFWVATKRGRPLPEAISTYEVALKHLQPMEMTTVALVH